MMVPPILMSFLSRVQQALSVGVEALRTNTLLQEEAQAVGHLARKVPALQPLAKAIDELQSATGLDRARALLNIAEFGRILLAHIAPTASLTADFAEYPEGPMWHFSSGNVHLILDAIREQNTCRVGILQRGIRRGEAFDCRLLDAVFDGLKTLHGPLAELLCRRVLPSHGSKILPDIRLRLKDASEQEQAYLLEAACTIDAHAMRDDCRAMAFQPGWVARDAVRNLFKVDPESAGAAVIAQMGNRYFNPPTSVMVKALQYSDSPVASALLLGYLSDPRVGPLAARLLRRRGVPNVVAYVRNRLEDPNFIRPSEILNAAAEFRDPALIPVFSQYCKAINKPETKSAIRGLMLIGTVESLRMLAEKIDESGFRQVALRAMWALPPRERYEFLAPLIEPALNVWQGTFALGDAVFDLFARPMPLLPKNRGWDERWCSLLLPHLEGPRRYDVLQALRVAGKGRAAVGETLLQRLDDVPPLLAAAMIRTLGHIGVRAAVQPLAALLRNGPIVVRQACVWALARLAAMAEVRLALDDREVWVRQTALKTMVLMQPERAKVKKLNR